MKENKGHHLSPLCGSSAEKQVCRIYVQLAPQTCAAFLDAKQHALGSTVVPCFNRCLVDECNRAFLLTMALLAVAAASCRVICSQF